MTAHMNKHRYNKKHLSNIYRVYDKNTFSDNRLKQKIKVFLNAFIWLIINFILHCAIIEILKDFLDQSCIKIEVDNKGI